MWRSKYFKDKIFAINPQNHKTNKNFPLEIFRLYGTNENSMKSSFTEFSLVIFIRFSPMIGPPNENFT